MYDLKEKKILCVLYSANDFSLNKNKFIELLFDLDIDLDVDNQKFNFVINDWKISLNETGKPKLVSDCIDEILNQFEKGELIKIEENKVYIPENKMHKANELISKLINKETIMNETTKYLLKDL